MSPERPLGANLIAILSEARSHRTPSGAPVVACSRILRAGAYAHMAHMERASLHTCSVGDLHPAAAVLSTHGHGEPLLFLSISGTVFVTCTCGFRKCSAEGRPLGRAFRKPTHPRRFSEWQLLDEEEPLQLLLRRGRRDLGPTSWSLGKVSYASQTLNGGGVAALLNAVRHHIRRKGYPVARSRCWDRC